MPNKAANERIWISVSGKVTRDFSEDREKHLP